jgi:hypothetical protein
MNNSLYINAHVFDIKSDRREDTKQFLLRKPHVNISNYETMREAEEAKRRQTEALEKKYKWIVDLIIWAATNGKSVEFVALRDDSEME